MFSLNWETKNTKIKKKYLGTLLKDNLIWYMHQEPGDSDNMPVEKNI